MTSSHRRMVAYALIALMLLICFGALLSHHSCSDMYCPVCQALAQRESVQAAMPLIVFGFFLPVGLALVAVPKPVSQKSTLVAEKVKITS